MDRVENYLSHYGVLGMRWGVRRQSGTSSSGTAKLHRRRKSEDFKTSRELRKKKHKQLSNEEIKKANERANLERNFQKLNPGKVERGRLRVEGMLALAATAGGVYALTKSSHGQAAIRLGKSFISSPAGKKTMKQGASIAVKQGASFT